MFFFFDPDLANLLPIELLEFLEVVEGAGEARPAVSIPNPTLSLRVESDPVLSRDTKGLDLPLKLRLRSKGPVPGWEEADRGRDITTGGGGPLPVDLHGTDEDDCCC